MLQDLIRVKTDMQRMGVEDLEKTRDIIFNSLVTVLCFSSSDDCIIQILRRVKGFIFPPIHSPKGYVMDEVICSLISTQLVKAINKIENRWIKIIFSIATFYLSEYMNTYDIRPEDMNTIVDISMKEAISGHINIRRIIK